jgi:protein arginine N-methyltransferase 3
MSDLPDLVDIDSAPTGHTAEQVAQQFEDDDAGDDASDEEAESECRCLLCASVLPSAVAAFQHCAHDHAFNFLQLRKQHKLDFYASMSALNLLRAQPADSTVAQRIAVFNQAVAAYGAQDASGPLSNGKYMQPADSDDPILFSFDDDSDDEDNQTNSNAVVPVAQYEAEINALRAQIAQMTEVMHRVALSGPVQVADSDSDSDEEMQKSKQTESNSFASPSAPGKKRDQGYFDGYSDMGIHEEMLRDTVRTLAYRDFMYNNRALFKDRVVLDIGCGTSILSLFAAEAGARRVIGVDRAAVVDRAAEIVKANGKADIVTLVKGRVEELSSLPESKVCLQFCHSVGLLFPV